MVMIPEGFHLDKVADIIFLCEHASNHIPAIYHDLGLGRSDLDQHIAFDIGAADLTRQIADMMQVPALLAPVSRLLIDLNRHPDDLSLIPEVSDDIAIPGNRHLSQADKIKRRTEYFDPFHDMAADLVTGLLARGRQPLVVGIHSFTPEMQGKKRPWDAGFLWNRDPRLSQSLIGLMERETDLTIGDNQPYSGKQFYYSAERHGENRQLPCSVIEIRQDHLLKPARVTEWAALLADLLDECLTRDDLK